MKNQKITVNTKKGLMAAFECAKDYEGDTVITLKRKTGISVYTLRPYSFDKYKNTINRRLNHYYYTKEKQVQGEFNQYVQKAKNKIKQTKAEDLLY